MTTTIKPNVSIAMTTYNAGRWLSGQLESFLAQSTLPDELVICDDGSTDETIEALHAFAATAPFDVRVECNERTLSTTRNFEKAVSLCRGDILFLADQDDRWVPHKIETLVARLVARPDVGAVFSNGRVVDEDDRPLGYDLWDALFFTPREQTRVRAGGAAEIFVKRVVAAGTTMAFRSRYRDVYLPFPELRSCHDAWLAYVICAVADIDICEDRLIDYHLHGANQIGLARFDLRQQLAKARQQVAGGAFRYDVEFFRAARDRIEKAEQLGYTPRPHVLELTEAKLRHASLRDGMSSHFLARLPRVVGEVLNRGYWRFGYGAKSAAQDLFLR